MKKLVTFCLLVSSIGLVGCNNFLSRLAVDDALLQAKNFDSGADVCLEYKTYGDYSCKKHVNLGEFDIVVDPADGANRVVLKRGMYEILNPGVVVWQYYGVDFSEADFTHWQSLSPADKVLFLVEKIEDGFQKYGYLAFEPADHDFFWDNDGVETIFSENVAAIKDVELMGTKVEDQNAVTLGEKLSAQYGLSNERGQSVAKTVAAYNKLASKRSLTPAEKDQFSTNLLGVDYRTAEKGIRSGDAKEFEALMERAARTNGTTPEAVSAIVRDMVL